MYQNGPRSIRTSTRRSTTTAGRCTRKGSKRADQSGAESHRDGQASRPMRPEAFRGFPERSQRQFLGLCPSRAGPIATGPAVDADRTLRRHALRHGLCGEDRENAGAAAAEDFQRMSGRRSGTPVGACGTRLRSRPDRRPVRRRDPAGLRRLCRKPGPGDRSDRSPDRAAGGAGRRDPDLGAAAGPPRASPRPMPWWR